MSPYNYPSTPLLDITDGKEQGYVENLRSKCSSGARGRKIQNEKYKPTFFDYYNTNWLWLCLATLATL